MASQLPIPIPIAIPIAKNQIIESMGLCTEFILPPDLAIGIGIAIGSCRLKESEVIMIIPSSLLFSTISILRRWPR
jgi:hypothetical protein